MIGSVLDCESLRVRHDPSSATWELTAGEAAFTIREWTWGERRRVISAAVVGEGDDAILDREAFVEGFTGLVADPVPDAGLRPLVAAAALRLLGARPGVPVPSLLETEAALAGTWRWGPAELDGQPAPRLDEHAARLRTTSGGPPGWSSILVGDD